jgi:hypothetical protein
MEIENLIRYAPRAVGLKPSAMQGKARLRGLWRIISSKTISPRLSRAKPACAGESGLVLQRPSGTLRPRAPCTGAALLRPSVCASCRRGNPPPANQGEARLRGTRTTRRIKSCFVYARSPPARNANSNGDPIDHRLSAIGFPVNRYLGSVHLL